ncbi:MAG: chemotaxis protein CheB [Leptospirales bacterium]
MAPRKTIGDPQTAPLNEPVKKPSPKPDRKPDTGFPIVGIGASAGGLEAFEEFFRHIKPDCGIAFVLISHLDPGHVSMLTEILQRVTVLPVIEVHDKMEVVPNSVYAIPPNRDMAISQGVLTLSIPDMPRGHRMPIDTFLTSLAKYRTSRSIGIILSGTGTDGTLGLKEIHGAGGSSFVQDPTTAKYDGMPKSAIQGGFPTHVLPVDKMADTLQKIVKHMEIHLSGPISQSQVSGINQILELLYSATGHNFSQYKKTTIVRRIKRRMAQLEIGHTDVYLRYLQEFPSEATVLLKELLINSTSFFRDPAVFNLLSEEILPGLMKNKPEGYVLRIWVPGCSTGEEAYSLAILVREFMERTRRSFTAQIYGTDLDEEAISRARAGVYSQNISQHLTPERLNRFFVKEKMFFRVKKEIRDMVVFAIQNVIKDPPFTRLDILSCRNLMIYLEMELQNHLILAFHYALKPGGILIISPSETVGNHADMFVPLNRKLKIYRAIPSIDSTRSILNSGLSWTQSSTGKNPQQEVMQKNRGNNFADLTRRALLNSYAPASVVTDLKGEILFVHGETGKYLQLASGQPSNNVIDMARDGLKLDLRDAMYTAVKINEPTLDRILSIKTENGTQDIVLSVRPLPDPETKQTLLLISFQDLPATPSDITAPLRPRSKKKDRSHLEALERDLADTKESLQITIEEQQASNEELKSTNEELQSTNEELQSTNEELEISKEELITINIEMQGKIEELANMQNDMKNLLDNINVGTIFLDENLRIRRFSRESEKIYHLIDSDLGRLLSDFKSKLVDADLIADARAVMHTLALCERELETLDGDWFLMRIQPYRTLDNVIDGVVMTFTDVTSRIESDELQRKTQLSEDIVNTVREPFVVLDDKLEIISANEAFYQTFRTSPENTVGQSIYMIGNRQWDIPEFKELLWNILSLDHKITGYRVEHDFPLIGHKTVTINGARIKNKAKSNSQMILLSIELANSD